MATLNAWSPTPCPCMTYAVEPILALHPHTRWQDGALSPLEVIGVELLYRGHGRPPDPALLGCLAAAGHEGLYHPVHVNLDTDGVLAMPDGLVAEAASTRPLVLEWTEKRVAAEDESGSIARAGERLAAWRSRFGVRVAIDDLGVGVDGIVRAGVIPGGPDILKVAGPLFQRARNNARTQSVITHVLQAIPSGVTPVLEWLETPEDLELARELAAPVFDRSGWRAGIQGWIAPTVPELTPHDRG